MAHTNRSIQGRTYETKIADTVATCLEIPLTARIAFRTLQRKTQGIDLSSAVFSIAFEGEPFDGGEIDIKDLAPALLALGDIVQAANKALNGDRADARLKVRATQEGSFEALLALDVSWVTDMLDVVAANPDRITAAKDLVELVFKAGGGAGAATIGVVQALKFIRGKKPEKVEESPSNVSITVNNTTVHMEPKAFQLLQDQPTCAFRGDPPVDSDLIRPPVPI